jgi:hypothetical protein
MGYLMLHLPERFYKWQTAGLSGRRILPTACKEVYGYLFFNLKYDF